MKDFLTTKAWKFGHVTEKSFHGRVLSYLTKYCCKPELIGQKHTMKPFTLISKGIGLSYLENLSDEMKAQMVDNLDFVVRYGNSKIQLPRYYVDKILPHSAADERNALLSGDVEKWENYRELRYRFQDKQKQVQRRRIESLRNVSYEMEYSDRQNRISATWANFKSKVNSRKDL